MPAAQGHCGQVWIDKQNTHKTLTIIADKRWTKHRQISVFSWPEIGWAVEAELEKQLEKAVSKALDDIFKDWK